MLLILGWDQTTLVIIFHDYALHAPGQNTRQGEKTLKNLIKSGRTKIEPWLLMLLVRLSYK